MATTPPLPGPVLDALRRGDTAEAVKLMRGTSGLALKDAAAAVNARLRNTGSSRPAPSKAPASNSLHAPVFSAGLPPLVVDALQRGEKIQAIRLMREITGVGLKEAKDAIDASPHAAARSGLSPGEVPRTGRTVWTVVAAALVVYLVYLALRSPG